MHFEKNTFFWKGYTHIERHEAIHDVSDIIDKYGFIVSFNMFSDIEIVYTIEISGSKIQELYNTLKNYVMLDEENIDIIDPKSECRIFLNLTFTQSSGNLKIEVPAVPG